MESKDKAMTALKPTSGPVKVDYEYADNEARYQVIRNDKYECVVGDGRMSDADAALICEAFNVHTETGLSPRQILEQRAELLSTVKRCRDWLIDWHDAKETLLEVDAIISNCEGTP